LNHTVTIEQAADQALLIKLTLRGDRVVREVLHDLEFGGVESWALVVPRLVSIA